MTIHAYAAMAAKKTLEPFEYEPAALGPLDCEIQIECCGICHSDLHLIDDDWRMSRFPLVPGHEIVGRVTESGSGVTHLAKGQRVGVGWQRGACLICDLCLSGHENLCAENRPTCVGAYGGFADRIRVDSRFVFPIPESLASENAAPLLCGGATVYSPLRRHGVRPDMRVGVVGIGGLGHLAVQFARAFGCEVTAFSTTAGKEAEAREFGAHHFVVTKDPGALKAVSGRYDVILSTVFASLDWAAYLQALRPNGRLILVGATSEPLSVPAFPLLLGQRSISGSAIAGRAILREMLEFAARHGIVAKTEPMPLADVNTGLERLRQGRARYRVVLRAPTE